jgi:5-methylcytosine-specific restriction endonuclease McrA
MPQSYYHTTHWKALRWEALKRDKHRCTVLGCGSTHRLTVDHIRVRPRHTVEPTPADVMDNLRTLCGPCHSRITRKHNQGTPRAIGCDANGLPLDPGHKWHG